MQSSHEIQSPSPWVVRWAPLVRAGGEVLDLACGSGRHARHFAARGCRVVAVDRDAAALASLAGVTGIVTHTADLEGADWPFAPSSFDAIVVANYLHRPLFGLIVAALRPGGVLVYETFMAGNERFGRPSNPHFLLRPGELLELVQGQLEVVAFEQGEIGAPRPAIVQRLCAVRGAASGVKIG
jgi:SAM-dependent methyltransferase